jgi:hypothetical protein
VAEGFSRGWDDGLKKRGGDPDDRPLKQTQAKVGELTMKLELAEMLLETS